MNSIRQRLTMTMLVGFGALWVAAGTTLYLALRAGLVAEFDNALHATAQGVAGLTTQDKGHIEVDFTGELMPGFARDRSPDYFQLWRADGTIVACSASLKGGTLPRRAAPVNDPAIWNLTLPGGQPGRAIGIRFIPPLEEDARERQPAPGPETAVTLVVARHRVALDQRLDLLATVLLLVGGALAAVTGFGVPAVVRRGLAPLDGLAERATTIDAHSLAIRFPTATLPAEMRPIGDRLNELLGRLEAAFDRERRFSADVAHELRTPIAELRTLAEVAIQWPDDPAETAKALHDALDIAVQMEAVATGLLTLARCEAGQQPLVREPVPLAALIHEIWQPLAGPAGKRQLAIALDLPENMTMQSDPMLLRAILNNLLSNAVEYSLDGGAIRVRAASGHLLVANASANLTSDDVPHLFERFWRKDQARSPSKHCGLGLALAKAYADVLGLQLTAALTESGTLVFTLSESRTATT